MLELVFKGVTLLRLQSASESVKAAYFLQTSVHAHVR